MGNKVPVPDDRLQRMIDMLRLTKRELAQLWRVFQRYDNDRGGTIDIEEFYRLIEEERTVFGDSLFELVDIDCSGALDFSEFVQTIGTYCLFGRVDVLKFCFFVFDKDKNGYIDSDELFALVEMLHGNNPSSNCRQALQNFDTNSDGKIDFGEFQALNNKFPMLLFPAFRMQEHMMANTLGKDWWTKKKATLQGERDVADAADEKLKLKELKRQQRNQQRQVRHKMGAVAYYVCFIKRGKVLAQIAAEEAIRQEKRLKKQELKEKQKMQQRNRRDLEDLFKSEDGGGKPGDKGGKEKKKKKKKKKRKDKGKGGDTLEEKHSELRKRRKEAQHVVESSTATPSAATQEDRARRKAARRKEREAAAVAKS
eukprot:CAMPEP_0202081404 /NCGR_PEP_ID=MMETSP0964-20121228/13995_1 /ASSEMBLY_ACC=CAM_ASM_000500 /TAXON_ID=4773 /ORGANISM="Schizochytrium aggregatum, Strain ATCC28209" /LENGTH=367 /DNA_ID=CAMNT_0048648959 /DNA_START=58 /DNA_END=1161 /DNA_ORIENTATION=+